MPSSKAIVLSRENFGEADRYVQFLTKEWGVITLLARSARKSKRRYVGGLDLFCHDEIFIKGDPREKAYLNELTVLNSFPQLRENLDKVMLAGKVVQWVKKLADAMTPMPTVYSLVGQTLSVIEREGDPERLELLGLVFRLKLLAALGLKPRVDACVRCGDATTTEVQFDVEAGGIVCARCLGGAAHEGLFLSREARGFLEGGDRIHFTAWEQINFPIDRTQALNRVVTHFASFHTHMKLPT